MKLLTRRFLCLLVTSSLATGSSVMLTSQLSAQEDVTLTTITGQEIQMKVDTIADGMIQGSGDPVSLGDLMMVQSTKTLAPERLKVNVLLSGGGAIGANSVQFNGERFVLDTAAGQLSVPPDAIKAILMDRDADMSQFNRALKSRSVEKDMIIANTTSGQRKVGGLIETIDETRVMLDFDGKSRPISLNKIVGIVPADLKAALPDGQIGTVKLTDGSTITGGIVGLEKGQLKVMLPGDVAVDLPFSDVMAITLRSSQVVYLSDLEPVDVSQNSLATLEFSWQRDLSVRGNPLRLFSYKSGTTTEYVKGIGLHAACRIEFENPKGFNRFVATVGIDAETEGNGDCDVSVWADGIKLWDARITGDGEPQTVDVDVSGMKKVALVVRNGKHLDLADHVDWADARFLKTEN